MAVVNIMVSKKLYDFIKEKSRETGIPMAKIIAQAVAEKYNIDWRTFYD